jgi:iron complex transport system substrate-binding protein
MANRGLGKHHCCKPGCDRRLQPDRNRWALDNGRKIKFLKSDPAVSQLDAVKKGHIVVMDGQAMNPTIRTIYGAEQIAEQLRKMGLN